MFCGLGSAVGVGAARLAMSVARCRVVGDVGAATVGLADWTTGGV